MVSVNQKEAGLAERTAPLQVLKLDPHNPGLLVAREPGRSKHCSSWEEISCETSNEFYKHICKYNARNTVKHNRAQNYQAAVF